ncbi:MAG: FG-GAP-like repeat-containing protein, partial [Candidatus Tenebribacter mawsonii]|nr:FG-GAP-like repeat-containing protein [Candidatus Tenebribacter mawsonii]
FVSWNFSGIDITISIAPTFIDLDNDGLLDLIFGESYGRLYHYEQDSINSYNFIYVTNSFTGDVGWGSIPSFGDIDNDGLLDLLVGGSNGLYHYEQESAGSYNFVFITQNFNGIYLKGKAPALVDINNDSLTDLMVGASNGGIHLFMQESYLFPDFIAEPTQGTIPLTVQFTDLSTPQDSIFTWKWYFGDTDSSSVQNPTHIYQEDGSYTVSLTITDADGFSITEVKQDYIQAFSVEIHNLDIGGNEDLQHLITHTPLITFEFYNAGGLTQTHYHIQVSTDSLFSVIDMWDTGVVGGSSSSVLYAGNPLVDGMTYYLRARVASGDAWSDWATLQFRMNSLPSIPVLLSPINNEIVFDSNPILWIMNSTDAELDTLIYYFELATEESFNNIIFIQSGVLEGVDSTSCQVTIALTDNFQYWWRARTNDGYQFCNYSNPESFVLNAENEPPGEFELFTPENGTEVTTLLPILDWEDAIDPDPLDEVSYTILIGDEIPNLISIDAGNESVYQLTNPLEDNTLYYWKVIATDLYGASTENTGGFHTFIVNTENNDPNSFDLITPTEYSVEIDLTPIFYWENAGDPDIGDTLTFFLYYDMDSLFIETVPVETDSNHYIPTVPLDDNSTYFWKVIAVDEAGFRASIESDTWLFWTNTELEPPNPFDLLSPENGEEGLSTTPEFVWNLATDNDPNDYAAYNLLISEDSTFIQTSFVYEALLDTLFLIPDDLDNNTQYFWRVDAVDTDSLLTQSEVWSFIVGYLSSEPDEVLPTKNQLSQNYPNPFNPFTNIQFNIKENETGVLSIYNIKGQLIESQQFEAGQHNCHWDASKQSSGVYLYSLKTESFSKTNKMLLLK